MEVCFGHNLRDKIIGHKIEVLANGVILEDPKHSSNVLNKNIVKLQHGLGKFSFYSTLFNKIFCVFGRISYILENQKATLLVDLQVLHLQPMQLYCDSQVTIHIVVNPVFYECTKHIEVNCHYIYNEI
ncbi:hypothetical protein CR513_34833, partial [Mucuna pruriens]